MMRYTDLGIGHLVPRVSEPRSQSVYGDIDMEADDDIFDANEVSLEENTEAEVNDNIVEGEDESLRYAEGADDVEVDVDLDDAELYDDDDDKSGYDSQ